MPLHPRPDANTVWLLLHFRLCSLSWKHMRKGILRNISLAKLTHYNPTTPMYSLGDKYRIVYGGGVCDSFKLELS